MPLLPLERLHGSRCCATGGVRAGALVANKTDLEDRVFGNARMRGQQFAQGYGLQYFETSAVRPEPRVPAEKSLETHDDFLSCVADIRVACACADEHRRCE